MATPIFFKLSEEILHYVAFEGIFGCEFSKIVDYVTESAEKLSMMADIPLASLQLLKTNKKMQDKLFTFLLSHPSFNISTHYIFPSEKEKNDLVSTYFSNKQLGPLEEIFEDSLLDNIVEPNTTTIRGFLGIENNEHRDFITSSAELQTKMDTSVGSIEIINTLQALRDFMKQKLKQITPPTAAEAQPSSATASSSISIEVQPEINQNPQPPTETPTTLQITMFSAKSSIRKQHLYALPHAFPKNSSSNPDKLPKDQKTKSKAKGSSSKTKETKEGEEEFDVAEQETNFLSLSEEVGNSDILYCMLEAIAKSRGNGVLQSSFYTVIPIDYFKDSKNISHLLKKLHFFGIVTKKNYREKRGKSYIQSFLLFHSIFAKEITLNDQHNNGKPSGVIVPGEFLFQKNLSKDYENLWKTIPQNEQQIDPLASETPTRTKEQLVAEIKKTMAQYQATEGNVAQVFRKDLLNARTKSQDLVIELLKNHAKSHAIQTGELRVLLGMDNKDKHWKNFKEKLVLNPMIEHFYGTTEDETGHRSRRWIIKLKTEEELEENVETIGPKNCKIEKQRSILLQLFIFLLKNGDSGANSLEINEVFNFRSKPMEQYQKKLTSLFGCKVIKEKVGKSSVNRFIAPKILVQKYNEFLESKKSSTEDEALGEILVSLNQQQNRPNDMEIDSDDENAVENDSITTTTTTTTTTTLRQVIAEPQASASLIPEVKVKKEKVAGEEVTEIESENVENKETDEVVQEKPATEENQEEEGKKKDETDEIKDEDALDWIKSKYFPSENPNSNTLTKGLNLTHDFALRIKKTLSLVNEKQIVSYVDLHHYLNEIAPTKTKGSIPKSSMKGKLDRKSVNRVVDFLVRYKDVKSKTFYYNSNFGQGLKSVKVVYVSNLGDDDKDPIIKRFLDRIGPASIQNPKVQKDLTKVQKIDNISGLQNVQRSNPNYEHFKFLVRTKSVFNQIRNGYITSAILRVIKFHFYLISLENFKSKQKKDGEQTSTPQENTSLYFSEIISKMPVPLYLETIGSIKDPYEFPDDGSRKEITDKLAKWFSKGSFQMFTKGNLFNSTDSGNEFEFTNYTGEETTETVSNATQNMKKFLGIDTPLVSKRVFSFLEVLAKLKLIKTVAVNQGTQKEQESVTMISTLVDSNQTNVNPVRHGDHVLKKDSFFEVSLEKSVSVKQLISTFTQEEAPSDELREKAEKMDEEEETPDEEETEDNKGKDQIKVKKERINSSEQKNSNDNSIHEDDLIVIKSEPQKSPSKENSPENKHPSSRDFFTPMTTEKVAYNFWKNFAAAVDSVARNKKRIFKNFKKGKKGKPKKEQDQKKDENTQNSDQLTEWFINFFSKIVWTEDRPFSLHQLRVLEELHQTTDGKPDALQCDEIARMFRVAFVRIAVYFYRNRQQLLSMRIEKTLRTHKDTQGGFLAILAPKPSTLGGVAKTGANQYSAKDLFFKNRRTTPDSEASSSTSAVDSTFVTKVAKGSFTEEEINYSKYRLEKYPYVNSQSEKLRRRRQKKYFIVEDGEDEEENPEEDESEEEASASTSKKRRSSKKKEIAIDEEEEEIEIEDEEEEDAFAEEGFPEFAEENSDDDEATSSSSSSEDEQDEKQPSKAKRLERVFDKNDEQEHEKEAGSEMPQSLSQYYSQIEESEPKKMTSSEIEVEKQKKDIRAITMTEDEVKKEESSEEEEDEEEEENSSSKKKKKGKNGQKEGKKPAKINRQAAFPSRKKAQSRAYEAKNPPSRMKVKWSLQEDLLLIANVSNFFGLNPNGQLVKDKIMWLDFKGFAEEKSVRGRLYRRWMRIKNQPEVLSGIFAVVNTRLSNPTLPKTLEDVISTLKHHYTENEIEKDSEIQKAEQMIVPLPPGTTESANTDKNYEQSLKSSQRHIILPKQYDDFQQNLQPIFNLKDNAVAKLIDNPSWVTRWVRGNYKKPLGDSFFRIRNHQKASKSKEEIEQEANFKDSFLNTDFSYFGFSRPNSGLLPSNDSELAKSRAKSLQNILQVLFLTPENEYMTSPAFEMLRQFSASEIDSGLHSLRSSGFVSKNKNSMTSQLHGVKGTNANSMRGLTLSHRFFEKYLTNRFGKSFFNSYSNFMRKFDAHSHLSDETGEAIINVDEDEEKDMKKTLEDSIFEILDPTKFLFHEPMPELAVKAAENLEKSDESSSSDLPKPLETNKSDWEITKWIDFDSQIEGGSVAACLELAGSGFLEFRPPTWEKDSAGTLLDFENDKQKEKQKEQENEQAEQQQQQQPEQETQNLHPIDNLMSQLEEIMSPEPENANSGQHKDKEQEKKTKKKSTRRPKKTDAQENVAENSKEIPENTENQENKPKTRRRRLNKDPNSSGTLSREITSENTENVKENTNSDEEIPQEKAPKLSHNFTPSILLKGVSVSDIEKIEQEQGTSLTDMSFFDIYHYQRTLKERGMSNSNYFRGFKLVRDFTVSYAPKKPLLSSFPNEFFDFENAKASDVVKKLPEKEIIKQKSENGTKRKREEKEIIDLEENEEKTTKTIENEKQIASTTSKIVKKTSEEKENDSENTKKQQNNATENQNQVEDSDSDTDSLEIVENPAKRRRIDKDFVTDLEIEAKIKEFAPNPENPFDFSQDETNLLIFCYKQIFDSENETVFEPILEKIKINPTLKSSNSLEDHKISQKNLKKSLIFKSLLSIYHKIRENVANSSNSGKGLNFSTFISIPFFENTKTSHKLILLTIESCLTILQNFNLITTQNIDSEILYFLHSSILSSLKLKKPSFNTKNLFEISPYEIRTEILSESGKKIIIDYQKFKDSQVPLKIWRKMNGDINQKLVLEVKKVILERIMMFPGILEEDVLEYFANVEQSGFYDRGMIMEILQQMCEFDKILERKFVAFERKKEFKGEVLLFSEDEDEEEEEEIESAFYYAPTKFALTRIAMIENSIKREEELMSKNKQKK